MMRTLLVPLSENLVSVPALDAALFVAKRLHSHIRALYIGADPNAPGVYPPIGMAVEMHQAIARKSRQAALAEKARFDAWRGQHDIADAANGRLDSCFATWAERQGEIDHVVTHFGLVSDMIIMSRFGASQVEAERCLDAAVFGTGRPTLIVPEKLPWDMLDHVMVAWNGSREASHAVFGALPLLHVASRVSIFTMPEPDTENADGAELAEALSWYGISMDHVRPLAVPKSVGPALLATAARSEATLIVMGAYTHSRLRQRFLGGATRHVLMEGSIPVLMSH